MGHRTTSTTSTTLKPMLHQIFPRQPCLPRSRTSTAEQLQRVFPEDVRLDVEQTADTLRAEIRHRARVRDETDGKVRRADRRHGKADAVEGNRALLDNPAQNLCIGGDRHENGISLLAHGSYLPHAVDVPADEMSAHARRRQERPLEVELRAAHKPRERRAPHGLRHDVRTKAVRIKMRDRKTDAVDGNAVADVHVRYDEMRADGDCAAREALEGADLLDDARKQPLTPRTADSPS